MHIRGGKRYLAHELCDDAVEGGALEVEGLARLAHALLAGAEGAEVLRANAKGGRGFKGAHIREKGIRLARKTQVGPCIPVGIQL
jgi:hypothetical protein